MSDSYTKIFRSITASTICSEPLATRWLWITLLSQTDASGCVWGSVPGLARLANITREECDDALACLLGPDADSRTKDHEGRRIECIDGGWRILNHAKYDAIRNESERAEYKRQWDRSHRPSGHARTVRQKSDSPTDSPTKSDSPTPLALTPSLSKTRAKSSLVRQAGRFSEFWASYPNKTGRKPCETKWKASGLDEHAETILAHVEQSARTDRRWLDGFVPNPATYLNQERWKDPIQAKRDAPATLSKTAQGIMALERLKDEYRR